MELKNLMSKSIWAAVAVKVIFVLFISLNSSCNKRGDNNQFNVKDYGAKGKISQKATKNIQKAIDACYEAGGGIVYFPPGEYLSGTLVMKSNVTLYLEAGAKLLSSRDTNDYKTEFKVYKKNDSGKKGKGETPVFLYALNANNIGIKGRGEINGMATREYRDLEAVDGFIADITENARKAGVEMKMYYKIPPYTCLIFFESCKNIHISEVSILESEDWTLHFKWCENVFVDNIYLYSSLEAGVNADGIDVDGCRNVVITNSIIETGDDAIVLKTTQTDTIAKSCENVTVSNCVLTSTSTALKLGTESFADFRHITFSNCVVRNSNRGLSIVVRDGATVENVLFSDITVECNRKHFNWWGNGDPIWVVLLKRSPDSKLGNIRNVRFENIIAHGQGTSKIEGFDNNPLTNIKLTNVQFFMHPEEYADKRATRAFEAHDVNRLCLDDVQVFWKEEKTEPLWSDAFHFENIKGLRLDKLCGKQAHPDKDSFISLKNVSNAIIERCGTFQGTNTFISVDGEKSENIMLNDNYSSNAKNNINVSSMVKKGAIKYQ